jgi:hypothetical protein
MITLRRFYRLFPHQPPISHEFELMAWLNAPSSNDLITSGIPAEEILRELVLFVTSEPTKRELFGVSLPQPYLQIQIILDGVVSLSNRAVTRLIQDAQRLHDLRLGNLEYKIFAEPACQSQLEAMDCVRRGHVALYRLPPWSEESLQQMLRLRLKSSVQGASSNDTDYDLGRFIPSSRLKAGARSLLAKTIAEGALRAYEANDSLDAPIHALRLARGLVAACAGCWKEAGYDPPLDHSQIQELIDCYWTTEEGKRDAYVPES